MTINAHLDVADFTNVGVVNSNEAYHTVAPAFKYAAATSVIKDISRFNNEAFKFHLRMDDVNSTSFKIMLGCDASGNGRAIQFDFSTNNKWIRLVNTTGIDAAYASVIAEKDIQNLMIHSSGSFIECRVEISNNKLRFMFNNLIVIDVTTFSTVGTHWGFCNLTGSSQVWTSDMFHVYDQILFGNVNLNGAPDANGIVIVYNQQTYAVVNYTRCDANGEYMVFIDDDPANANKYFLYGFITGLGTVQPRGVSNITL